MTCHGDPLLTLALECGHPLTSSGGRYLHLHTLPLVDYLTPQTHASQETGNGRSFLADTDPLVDELHGDFLLPVLQLLGAWREEHVQSLAACTKPLKYTRYLLETIVQSHRDTLPLPAQLYNTHMQRVRQRNRHGAFQLTQTDPDSTG